ncbi:hypothetical protein E2320_003078 [Naja naja]|nr:hypothetical protein E2320_003078 [Naja naja]
MPQNSTLRGSDVITGSAVPEGAALHPETKGGGGVESRNTQGVWGEEADRVTLFSNILRLLLPPSTSPSIIDYILLRCYRDITVPRSKYNEVLIPSHANTLLVLRDITHKNTQTHTGRKIGRNANQRAMQGKGIEKNWQLLGGGEELKKKQKRDPKKWLNKGKMLERRRGRDVEGGSEVE